MRSRFKHHPMPFQVGDRVCDEVGLLRGTVRWIGYINEQLCVGIESDRRIPGNMNDGIHRGIQYFHVRKGHAVFVNAHRLCLEYDTLQIENDHHVPLEYNTLQIQNDQLNEPSQRQTSEAQTTSNVKNEVTGQSDTINNNSKDDSNNVLSNPIQSKLYNVNSEENGQQTKFTHELSTDVTQTTCDTFDTATQSSHSASEYTQNHSKHQSLLSGTETNSSNNHMTRIGHMAMNHTPETVSTGNIDAKKYQQTITESRSTSSTNIDANMHQSKMSVDSHAQKEINSNISHQSISVTQPNIDANMQQQSADTNGNIQQRTANGEANDQTHTNIDANIPQQTADTKGNMDQPMNIDAGGHQQTTKMNGTMHQPMNIDASGHQQTTKMNGTMDQPMNIDANEHQQTTNIHKNGQGAQMSVISSLFALSESHISHQTKQNSNRSESNSNVHSTAGIHGTATHPHSSTKSDLISTESATISKSLTSSCSTDKNVSQTIFSAHTQSIPSQNDTQRMSSSSSTNSNSTTQSSSPHHHDDPNPNTNSNTNSIENKQTESTTSNSRIGSTISELQNTQKRNKDCTVTSVSPTINTDIPPIQMYHQITPSAGITSYEQTSPAGVSPMLIGAADAAARLRRYRDQRALARFRLQQSPIQLMCRGNLSKTAKKNYSSNINNHNSTHSRHPIGNLRTSPGAFSTYQNCYTPWTTDVEEPKDPSSTLIGPQSHGRYATELLISAQEIANEISRQYALENEKVFYESKHEANESYNHGKHTNKGDHTVAEEAERRLHVLMNMDHLEPQHSKTCSKNVIDVSNPTSLPMSDSMEQPARISSTTDDRIHETNAINDIGSESIRNMNSSALKHPNNHSSFLNLAHKHKDSVSETIASVDQTDVTLTSSTKRSDRTLSVQSPQKYYTHTGNNPSNATEMTRPQSTRNPQSSNNIATTQSMRNSQSSHNLTRTQSMPNDGETTNANHLTRTQYKPDDDETAANGNNTIRTESTKSIQSWIQNKTDYIRDDRTQDSSPSANDIYIAQTILYALKVQKQNKVLFDALETISKLLTIEGHSLTLISAATSLQQVLEEVRQDTEPILPKEIVRYFIRDSNRLNKKDTLMSTEPVPSKSTKFDTGGLNGLEEARKDLSGDVQNLKTSKNVLDSTHKSKVSKSPRTLPSKIQNSTHLPSKAHHRSPYDSRSSPAATSRSPAASSKASSSASRSSPTISKSSAAISRSSPAAISRPSPAATSKSPYATGGSPTAVSSSRIANKSSSSINRSHRTRTLTEKSPKSFFVETTTCALSSNLTSTTKLPSPSKSSPTSLSSLTRKYDQQNDLKKTEVFSTIRKPTRFRVPAPPPRPDV